MYDIDLLPIRTQFYLPNLKITSRSQLGKED